MVLWFRELDKDPEEHFPMLLVLEKSLRMYYKAVKRVGKFSSKDFKAYTLIFSVLYSKLLLAWTLTAETKHFFSLL